MSDMWTYLSQQDKADLTESRVLILSHIALAIVCVLFTLWMALSAISDVNETTKDRAMERAGRLYSILIKEQWGNVNAIEETLSFVRESERGVVDVWLVNSLAGVVSPLEKAYQVLSDAELDKVLEEPPTNNNPIVVNDKVYIPISGEDNELSGVLILQFSERLGSESSAGDLNILGSIVFGVLLSILVGGMASLHASRDWRSLLRDVENDFDNTNQLSMPRPSLDTAVSTREKHQFLYYRLLSKVRRS